MSPILSIFRKDARHLWPHITAFLILLALAALLDPTYTSRDAAVYSVLGALLPLACSALVIAVIHEEKLPGDRQYWLTRPLSPMNLLAAKALFVAVFLNLPVFLCHLAVLAAVGIPPFAYLPTLLWRQVFFSVFYILPVAVLAAITRSLGQLVLAAVLLLLPVALLEGFFVARLRMARPGVEWMTTAVMAAILAGGAATILAFQYAHRQTALSRVLTGAVALAVVAATWIPIDRAFPKRPVATTVRISPGNRTGPPPNPLSNTQNTVALEFPVRVEGIPPGIELVKNRITVGVRAPGRRFGPPHYVDGGLHDLSNGAGWLTLVIDNQFFGFVGNLTVTMTGSLDYTLFQPLQTLPLPGEHGVVAPRVGVCSRAIDSTGWNSIICYTPFPQAALYVRMPRGGANWIVPGGFVGPPVPTAAGFQPLSAFSNLLPLVSSKEMGDAQLVTARPLTRSETQFEFSGIRLADYAMPLP